MSENQVAVLIDGENISPKYAAYIKQEAARLGQIKIFRLYGSINSPSIKAWYYVMPEYGINPMLQIWYAQGKSIADQALTIDAMDILYSGDIDIICLVTSDSDFTKLAYRIKESGKTLIGMGEQKTTASLAQACDEFKVLDIIYQIKESDEIKDTDHPQEITEATPEKTDDEENLADENKPINIPEKQEIIKIILNLLDDNWENLASIGKHLNQQISGFDARNYGYKNMTQFIRDNSDIFELKFEAAKDGIHSIVYVKKTAK